MREHRHITVGDVLDGPDPFTEKKERAKIDTTV